MGGTPSEGGDSFSSRFTMARIWLGVACTGLTPALLNTTCMYAACAAESHEPPPGHKLSVVDGTRLAYMLLTLCCFGD